MLDRFIDWLFDTLISVDLNKPLEQNCELLPTGWLSVLGVPQDSLQSS